MKSKLLKILVVCSVFLAGCKVTGPADDEWDKKDNNTYNTGRLFSKDGSALTIYSNEEKDKESALFHSNKDRNDQSASSSSSPASDYESYKQWSEAKKNDSAEYEKFKKWQEFEEYQRWKDQQQK